MILELIGSFNLLATGLEALIIPLIIAGGVVSTVAAVQQGRAAKAAGKAQEAIAERNALLAERQAEQEQLAALEAAKVQEREGKRLLARQRAMFAISRVQIGKGTPLSVVVEQAAVLKAEELTILTEGAIAASQRRAQAGILRAGGAAARARGRAAGRASILTAIGTGLSTAGAVGLASSRFKSPVRRPSGRATSGFDFSRTLP